MRMLVAVVFVAVLASCSKEDPVGPQLSAQENQEPVAVEKIADADLIEGEAEAVFNLSLYFQDADADELTFTAMSSDESVAKVSVSDSTLTITPVSQGNATVTVKATDSSGLSATQSIQVSVEAAGPPLTGPYVPLEWVRVSPGRIELRPVSFIPITCLELSATINDVTYRIHFSHWQRRDNSNSSWTDIPGTRKVGKMCGYTPDRSGEYRLVMELSIDGVRKRYSSANTITALCDLGDCQFFSF